LGITKTKPMEREMKKTKITAALNKGAILVSDGAWGTFLIRRGLKPGECPEKWCLEHPEAVFEIAKSYLYAGSDMIETNSFGGSRYKLDFFGLADKTPEINRAAAEISRKAAGDEKWVIASMGPTGRMLLTGDVSEEDLYNVFREQALALEEGGADGICIETMSDLGEALQAIRAVKENTHCEVLSTFTFGLTKKGEYRTMMGVAPGRFAEGVVEAGADIIGTNCGNGVQRMVDIVRELRSVARKIPILVQANAGLPTLIDGKEIYPDTPEEMAKWVPELIAAGANIIGGCCGTTPDHIKAIKRAVASFNGRGLQNKG
jgi:5-methyltetrahydrofolate--homocysteine methyltransferase